MKKLTWYKQEKHYSCIPACLKMVFEHCGIIESEAAIRVKCTTKFIGTHPFNAMECCNSFGLESYIELTDLVGLKLLLN